MFMQERLRRKITSGRGPMSCDRIRHGKGRCGVIKAETSTFPVIKEKST